jgi:DNA-binding response OmpR family regulator
VKILIVDDNAQYREAFVRTILLENYEVCEAPDTDEALRIVMEQQPDVVVTDLQMRTDREGLDLIEILKAYDPLLPVIMISGVGSFEEGALATKVGAAHVIHKSRIEDEMKGFFETVRTAHAAATRSREQLVVVAAAREQGVFEEGDARLDVIRRLLADDDVDPYVKGEAFDFIASRTNPDLLRESLSTMQAAVSSERYEELCADAVERLRAELPDFGQLARDSKRALTTAEYLLGAQGESGAPDFARSIAFSYSLAVECEVRARLKGRITRLANDPQNRRLFEACVDPKSGRVDAAFQGSLMVGARRRNIKFTIANVKYILLGLLSRKGKFKADGLKDVGIILLCFARHYAFPRWGQQIKVENPMRVRGLQSDDQVLTLAGLLIKLQYARNPYVHPNTGKCERLAALRQTALDCLNELSRVG